jgi:Putative zinc-binding metallo-peptidase
MRLTDARAAASSRPAGSPAWAQLDDDALLKLRLSDLPVTVASSPVRDDVERVYGELERRGIRFRPHVWFSTEWFSPDGVPGIAIPFFLAHPRLKRLETRLMGQAEGGNRRWRLRLLRHEIGHALDTAYGLRRRQDWRAVFGRASLPYPSTYTVQPKSRDYVLHLEHWYAQSHPTEDFAETFAVWLQPKARWSRDYAGWPALAKLHFVDRLMAEIGHRAPRTRDRSRIAPLSDNTRTLGEHYRRRASWRDAEYGHPYDARLRATWPTTGARTRSAGTFLRESATQLKLALERRSHQHRYLIWEVVRTLRRRAYKLELRLSGSRRENFKRALSLHESVVADMARCNEERYYV